MPRTSAECSDANRQIVVASNALSAIKALIFRPQLVPYVIPVLFNICMDYGKSSQHHRCNQADRNRASTKIGLRVARKQSFGRSYAKSSHARAHGACRIHLQNPGHARCTTYVDFRVNRVKTNEAATELDNASPNTAVVLFSLVEDETDDEDFLALTTSGIAYLQHPIFQEALLTESLEHTLDIMSKSYDRPAEASEDLESDVPEQLTTMRNNMTVALSDISVLPSFPAKYPINSDLTDRLQNWLSSPHKQLQICACVMLGNMARSVETCIELVQTRRILVPLLNILKTTNDPQLLHSTIGFLKNLALPLPNKTPLGEAGTIEAIEKLWTLSTQAQLQYSSISLTRQLCISTVSNVQRICADSTSRIITLLSVFRSTDSTPTKMEIARLFATIGRVYATLPEDSIDSAQTFFGENPAIAEPLAYLIPQKEWPAIRSEGYFVMALMARTTKGAAIVAGVLEDDAAMQAITQLFAAPESEVFVAGVEGEQGPEADAKKGKALQSKDRENVLVLLNELLKHGGSALKEDSRARLEILLKNGGEVHL